MVLAHQNLGGDCSAKLGKYFKQKLLRIFFQNLPHGARFSHKMNTFLGIFQQFEQFFDILTTLTWFLHIKTQVEIAQLS